MREQHQTKQHNLSLASGGSALWGLVSRWHHCRVCLVSALYIVLCSLMAMTAAATPMTYPLSYSGRLVGSKGEPLSGPLQLEFSFYDKNGVVLGSPYTISDVPLVDGVFQVTMDLEENNAAAIFTATHEAVWIEVKDVAANKTYPRQRYSVVPFALKVPVDNATIGYDVAGKLKILSVPPTGLSSVTAGTGMTGGGTSGAVTLNVDVGTAAHKIVQLDSNAKLPAVDGSALTAVNAAQLKGLDVSSTAPTTGQVLKWDGASWAPGSDDGGVAGAVNNAVNLGTDSGTTAGIVRSIDSGTISLRRLSEGSGIDVVQNADDIAIAITSGGVSTALIASDAVTSAKIADGEVSGADLADGAITSFKILDGEVASADIATSAVTSDKIADGTIATADIADAAITDAKLAGITTAGKVSGDAITSGTIAGSSGYSGTGGVSLRSAGATTTELRFYGTNNTNYVGFKALNGLAADTTWILPGSDGTSGQVLTTDGSRTLTWASPNAGTITGVTAGSGLIGGGSSGGLTLSVNVGTNAGQIVQLDANAKLPAVDGSALTNLAPANLSAAVDIAKGGTGATTAAAARSNLGLGSLATLSTISTAEIPDGTVVTADLADNAVATAKIAANAVTSAKILDGEVASADIATGAVTSDKIANGTIATADIADAAITDAKLAGITTAGKVSGDAITSGTIAGSSGYSGTGGVSLRSAGATTTELRFYGTNNTNYVGFKALNGLAADTTWILPSSDGTGGQVLTTDGSRTLTWASPNAGTITGVTAGSGLIGGGSSGGLTLSVNVGTNAGQIVQLDANAKLPAVDGSALTNLAPGNLSAAVDIAKGGTGATTAAAARTNLGLGSLATLSTISTAEIPDGTVVTADLADNAVATAKIAANAVTSAKILDGEVASADIATGAVTSDKIANGTIATADIADAAITDAKLAGITTAGKVSGDAITSGTIAGSTVISTTGHITTTGNLTVNGGNVGIGTLAPAAKLQVNGQAASVVNNDSDLNIDFNSGNIQATSAGPGNLVFSNMIDGATYMLALQNTTAGSYVLSATGVTNWRCSPACTSNTISSTADTHTILSLMKIGNTAYVSWIDRF